MSSSTLEGGKTGSKDGKGCSGEEKLPSFSKAAGWYENPFVAWNVGGEGCRFDDGLSNKD
jgi:hypothetical protein